MDLQRTPDPQRLSFGEFTLDVEDERLIGPSGPVKIGNKAYRVLLALIERDGRLLTKDAVFSSVWDGTIVSEASLTSVIRELRRALCDESSAPRFIESVYGRGYRFLAPVADGSGDGSGPMAGGDRLERAAPSAATANDAPPLVVVSAFDDSAVGDRYPHCAAQLREEVLSGLARFREIRLVAEDGSSPALAADADPGRAYRISATLLPQESGVRVAARASRLADGLVIWAEALSLADEGMAGGVEKIVRRIVGSALPALDEDVSLGLPSVSDAFYDRYLIAKRRSLQAADVEEARAAAAELEELVAERPDFGLAYPPLVRLYNTDFGFTAFGASGMQERARALALAKGGLAADRRNVHAYTVLAFCHLYNGEHELADACLEQAVALNPYNPVRLNEVAAGKIYMGDLERAGSLLDMSLHLQGFADDSFHEDKGRLEFLLGEVAAARVCFRTMTSRSIWADLYLALTELRLGWDEGRERFAKWEQRVSSGWHTRGAPTREDLQQWVRRHHPFAGEAGAPLFAALDEALGQAPPPPAAPARAPA